MSLRDWPPSKIRWLWLWGIAAEAVWVMLSFGIGHFQQFRMERRVERELAQAESINARRSPQEWDSLRALTRARLESAGVRVTQSGDTLTRLAYNDSQSVTLVAHRDTMTRLELSPAAERGVGRVVGTATSRITVGLGWTLIVLALAAAYLPIPVVLGVITLMWWRQRSRRARGLPVAT
jgi:hypothetical protein